MYVHDLAAALAIGGHDSRTGRIEVDELDGVDATDDGHFPPVPDFHPLATPIILGHDSYPCAVRAESDVRNVVAIVGGGQSTAGRAHSQDADLLAGSVDDMRQSVKVHADDVAPIRAESPRR
jgi:hypothetical protein